MTRGLSQGVIERIREQIKLEFGVEQVYFTAPTFVTREVLTACVSACVFHLRVHACGRDANQFVWTALNVHRSCNVSCLLQVSCAVSRPLCRLATLIGALTPRTTCTGIRTWTKTTRTTTTTQDCSTCRITGRLSPPPSLIALTPIALILTHQRHHRRHPGVRGRDVRVH